MTMVEATATVAVVSSIIQLVDLASKLVSRLDDLPFGTSDAPKSFIHLCVELAACLTAHPSTHSRRHRTNQFSPESVKALQPVISGCDQAIHDIGAIISECSPVKGDGRRKASLKTVGSVWTGSKGKQITLTLQRSVATSSSFFSALSSKDKLASVSSY